MNLGRTIKSCRKKCGLTQEQVATAVGVSKPAVSKWESGSAYPDITLLAPLARLFGTTVDNLLAYNLLLSENEIDEITSEFERTRSTSGWDKAMAYAEDQLHQYPNVYGLKVSIAQSYFQCAILATDTAYQEKAISRSFELLQQVAACKEQPYKEAALTLFAQNALLMGRCDEALNAAKQLPPEKVETEILLATIYFHCGEYPLCKALSQKILFRSYKNCDLSLGLLEKVAYRESEYETSLSLLNKHVCFYTLFGVDSASSILFEMVEVFAGMGEEGKVIELLNRYLLALEEERSAETQPFFDQLDMEAMPNGYLRETAFAQLREYLLSSNLFTPFLENEEFKKVVDKIKQHQ